MSIIIELINKLSQSLMSKSKFFLENKNIKTKHPAHFCIFFFFQSYLEYKNVWTKTTGKFFNHYSWGGWIFSWSWKYFINVIATFFNFLYDKCWQSLNFNNKWLFLCAKNFLWCSNNQEKTKMHKFSLKKGNYFHIEYRSERYILFTKWKK